MFKKPDEADKTSKNELEAARRAAAAKTAQLRALRLARDAADVEATGMAYTLLQAPRSFDVCLQRLDLSDFTVKRFGFSERSDRQL